MIKGRCFTNIDKDQHIRFPNEFVAVPRHGERVSSVDGKHSRKVCGIEYGIETSLSSKIIPIVVIELTI